MQPKMIWANMAVASLERTTKFYTALGFKQNGKPNEQLTSFFFADNAFIIHFFLKEALTANTNMEIADVRDAGEILFTLSAESKDEVNQWAKAVADAGGKLHTQPAEFGEGYYGFVFADPDGHRFNIFHM